MKKTLIISSGILVLILVSLLLFPFFFKQKIVDTLKTEINKSLLAKVDFTDVDITIFKNFPNFTLSLQGLNVVGVDGFAQDTLINAQDISFTLDLGSVLNGNYQIKKIYFNEVVLKLLVTKEGKANWDIVKPDTVTVEEPTEETTPFKMQLKSVVFENINIQYLDFESDYQSFIRNFNMDLSGDMTASEAVLSLTSNIESMDFTMENVKYLNQSKMDLEAKIGANLDSFKFNFMDNLMHINGMALKFDGFVAMPQSDIAMDLTFSAPEADLKSIMSLIPAFYLQGYEQVKVTGAVEFSGFAKGIYGEYAMPAFDLALKVNEGSFQYPDLPEKVEKINIDMLIHSPSSDMNDMVISVNKFDFSILKNPMSIFLKLKTPLTDPDIDARFKGKLNLESLTKVYPMDPNMRLQGTIAPDITLQGKQSSLDKGRYQDFKATGSVVINNLFYSDADIPDGVLLHKASMNFTPQYIELPELKATYTSNTLNASGRLNNYIDYMFSDGILSGDLKINADMIDLDKMMASEQPATTATTDTTVTTMTVFEVPKNIDFNLQCSVGRLIYDKMEIKAFSGKIHIVNQQLILDKMRMELLGGEMTMGGYYNTENPKQPKTHFLLSLNNFDFAQTYLAVDMVKQLAPIMKNVTGNFSCILSYEGLLDEQMNPDLKSIASKGLLSTSGVGITNSTSLNALATALKYEDLKNISTAAASIPFEIKEGKLIVKPFTTKINGMPLTTDGETGLDQNIKYNLNLTVPREKVQQGSAGKALTGLIQQANAHGAGISETSDLNIKAIVGGTVTKPTVKLDYSQAKANVEQVVQEQIQIKTDELKQKAQEEADRIRKEMEEKAKAELQKQKEEAEKKAKEAEERLKKKAADELKKAAGNLFK